jgi:transposase-like protein
VATLKSSLEAWQTRPLTDLEFAYAHLDALALRVRSGGKVVSVPVLAVVGVLADGQKVLVELELCGRRVVRCGTWSAKPPSMSWTSSAPNFQLQQ